MDQWRDSFVRFRMQKWPRFSFFPFPVGFVCCFNVSLENEMSFVSELEICFCGLLISGEKEEREKREKKAAKQKVKADKMKVRFRV